MTQKTGMYWIHAVSPLHIGAGRGVGYIDLPVVREKVTGWPYAPGSAIKGVLADHHGATDEERDKCPKLRAAFGKAGDQDSNSGSIVFTDARLVCLPVRSFYGTFAWCTSAMALARLKRDLELASQPQGLPKLAPVERSKVLFVEGSDLCSGRDKQVYFEDLDFVGTASPEAGQWAESLAKWVFPDDADWQAVFRKRFAVLPDEAFDFLSETGTEVNARIRIDDKRKTVAGGALWYEESLPVESILAGLVSCDQVFVGGVSRDELWDRFCAGALDLQLGGKATVGKGRVRCVFVNGGTNHGGA